MAEYIEREARLREIDKAFEEYGQNGDILKLFSECRASILFAPTADVEEVRHGEWIPYLNEYKGYVTSYNCSLCNRRVTDKEPYCHCGAKMD